MSPLVQVEPPEPSLWFTLLKRDVSPLGKKSQNRTVPSWLIISLLSSDCSGNPYKRA